MVLLWLTTLEVRDQISEPEIEVFRAINHWPDVIYSFLWTAMQLGNFVAVPVVTAAALVLRRVRLALDLAVSGTAAWLTAKLLKEIFERGRPGEVLADVTIRGDNATGYGFVSGHSATAVALAAAAHPYVGRWGKVVVWTIAVLVCIARIYVGAHLPLDVIGGAAVGGFLGALVHVILGVPEDAAGPDETSRDASSD